MTSIEPITLTGQYVVLEPLSRAHHDGLVGRRARRTALGALVHVRARAGVQWPPTSTGGWPSSGRHGPALHRAAAGHRHGRSRPVIGMTTSSTPIPSRRAWRSAPPGWRRSAQGTGVNAESKLLLLTHAFEALGCVAVEFRTHWLNHASRAAIARLGAKQDGVLRNHRRMPDGTPAGHRGVLGDRVRVAGGAQRPGVQAREAALGHGSALTPRPPLVEDRALSHWPDPYNASTQTGISNRQSQSGLATCAKSPQAR